MLYDALDRQIERKSEQERVKRIKAIGKSIIERSIRIFRGAKNATPPDRKKKCNE